MRSWAARAKGASHHEATADTVNDAATTYGINVMARSASGVAKTRIAPMPKTTACTIMKITSAIAMRFDTSTSQICLHFPALKRAEIQTRSFPGRFARDLLCVLFFFKLNVVIRRSRTMDVRSEPIAANANRLESAGSGPPPKWPRRERLGGIRSSAERWV